MQTKVSVSGTGVKKIYTPRNPTAIHTVSAHTISALVRILRKQGVCGVHVWLEIDEDINEEVFHVEVGREQHIGYDLMSCILKAADEMPHKRCGNCGEDTQLNLFPRNKKSPDGRGSYCNICNRSPEVAKERADGKRSKRYRETVSAFMVDHPRARVK